VWISGGPAPASAVYGQGSIDLINYGWEYQPSSINIGASGVFIDGVGNQLAFYPGMRVADLRTLGWYKRIRSFRITG
jgi:hypothetical protein